MESDLVDYQDCCFETYDGSVCYCGEPSPEEE